MRLCLLAAVFTGVMIGAPDRTTGQAPEPLPRGIESFYLLMTFLLFATSRDGMLVPLEFGPYKFPAHRDILRKARKACGK